MITDILARLAVLYRQVPDDEFDCDRAVETAIDGLERDVTDAEREELDRVLPEWLEDNDTEVPA
jgi:hypothetical protein